MVICSPSWQEMLGTLPPGEQAEIGALLAGCGQDETADDGTP
jgi:hypothetical protein